MELRRAAKGWRAAGIVIIAAILVAIPALATKQTAKHSPPVTKTAAVPDEYIVKAIGSKSAPVTMEVFSDYQCPSCGSLYEQTLKPLIADYVASGKVYLVHRDFPLPLHKYGYEAARWVSAAALVGKYPEVEAALYDNQAAWSVDGNIQKYVAAAMSPVDFKRVAKMMEVCPPPAAGVSPASYSQTGKPAAHGCPFDASIEKDKALGNTVPVSATPTFRFYYKGKTYGPMSGVVSWPIMKQFLDQVISQ
ncbi:MAG: thioredoxin domain-containing protein [Candidatus Acidiferrales bacterium]